MLRTLPYSTKKNMRKLCLSSSTENLRLSSLQAARTMSNILYAMVVIYMFRNTWKNTDSTKFYRFDRATQHTYIDCITVDVMRELRARWAARSAICA